MKFTKKIYETDFINNELIIPFTEHKKEFPQAFIYQTNEDGGFIPQVMISQSINEDHDLKLSVGRDGITAILVIV